nr:NAD(P)H-binding protein [Gemmatimonadaceae bacterium]
MATYLVLGHTVRRATSRTPSEADQVHLDLVTGAGLDAALAGVDGVFLLSPPGHVNQDALLVPVIDAAVRHGVRRAVLMTAMGVDADPTAPLRRAELHLEASGLAWNVIRPNWFMQNFHSYWLHGIRTAGEIVLPTDDAQGSFIDARDIAAVAHVLLTTDRHANAAFDLTGGESLDHHAVAAILTEVLGHPITYRAVTADAMRPGLLAAGLPPAYVESLLTILEFFRLGYAARVTDAVATITGRPPRTFV